MNLRELFKRPIRVKDRATAYKLFFTSPAGNIVLQDLAQFCRAAETCVVPDNRDLTLVLEGRREVFLRINEHVNLNSEQLFALYGGHNILTNEGDNDA